MTGSPAQVAALYVEKGGCYFGLDGVDPWDKERDARLYAGPHPVVAHPPCQRWGRFWHGSTRKPHQYRLGDDDGCFEAALSAVRRFGGILEHPADSHAWPHFGIHKPWPGRWIACDRDHGWTCEVEQGHYGHVSRKRTWLYACRGQAPRVELPELKWGPSPQRIHPRALELHGYAKARRIGMMAMIGGKDKTKLRNATPPAFRDLLISIARTAPPIGETRVSIIESAKDELRRINFGEDDTRVMVEILEKFFDQWDSGGAVHAVAPILQRCIAGKPLSPLTGADDEWVEVGTGVFQNKRLSSVFKDPRFHDGKLAYDIDSANPRGAITFPYYPKRADVSSPVVEIG